MKDELKEIRGIGDAKAEAVLSVLEEQDEAPNKEKVELALQKLQSGKTKIAENLLAEILNNW